MRWAGGTRNRQFESQNIRLLTYIVEVRPGEHDGTATIPEDWENLSGQSQEMPNSCTCIIPEGRQHEVGFYYKCITHFTMDRVETGRESWKCPYATELTVKRWVSR